MAATDLPERENQQLRVMRVALPVQLIRAMDDVIRRGVAGYETRADFIVDAINERILELTVTELEHAGTPPALDAVHPRLTVASESKGQTPETLPPAESATPQLATTALHSAPQGHVLTSAFDDVAIGPLFGLHNRDYPSLWVLADLAAQCADGPTPIDEWTQALLKRAWEFGQILALIEKNTGRKTTALFPTNPEKRKAAEGAFLMFAVGEHRRVAERRVATSGPLYQWNATRLDQRGDQLLIGVTSAGWRLLDIVSGISVEEPHRADVAVRFLRYLAEEAPADHAGFAELVQAIGVDGASRADVLAHFGKVWPDWTENEISTNSAGYVARAREWGLLEARQDKGLYHLTELGQAQLAAPLSEGSN